MSGAEHQRPVAPVIAQPLGQVRGQVRVVIVPAARAGGCVSGAEHQRPVAPVIAQPLGQVPPHSRPSLSYSSSVVLAGGEHQ